MEFSKDLFVKIESMNQDEARAFIIFLETEKLRHANDIKLIDRRIKAVVELKLSGENWQE